ncbi:hypothetical protein AB0H76_20430 [Nocardia sp. NPDC050712]|uniref:hypothetical protein n=1 Tax=Nocardia sp. NPDC050712 TaxID=3155518 RepID=UPI0033F691C5
MGVTHQEAQVPPARRPLDPRLPTDNFALALRDLHRSAGRPKYRILAATINASNATVSAILNGHRFPSWEQTKGFVQACDGDLVQWKRLWTHADLARATNAADYSRPPTLPPASLTPVTGADFYAAMLAEIRRARYRIMTSYIRLRPPSYFLGFTDERTSRVAGAYFEEVVAWASGPGRRSVRRVIATPNEEMRQWARELADATADQPNHRIHLIDWPLSADGVNFAIFDDTVAFLAFTTGTTQQLSGFRIEEPAFVHGAIGYFEQLWLAGRALPA